MKTLTAIFSLISLILLLSFPSPSTSDSQYHTTNNIFRSAPRCNPQDKKALLTIKTALGNPYHLKSWDPETDCCGWYCLECDRNTNRVIALTIFNGELAGHIPSAVGDLPYLENLFFHKLPNLIGTIPQTVTKLTHLKYLEVSWTNISGPIPDFLSQIKSLKTLDLSFNNLNGSIPASLSELPNLTELHLDRNKLTGSIPNSFGTFKGNPPPSLYLSHNRLTGYVPKSLGYPKFPNLDFSRNNLQGDISFLFGSDKPVWKADFSKNQFKFDLSKVAFPKGLSWLDLNHNKIYGNLPQGLTAVNLQYLNVSYNQLCGKIPVGGELQKFETTVYFQNQCLCGAPLKACK